ncbi:MAG: alkaline phosphatase family protein [Bdellovibrionales bacterium]|nr:alkaline phosphatase family protein [Bdellovibrionales bacterium]
MKNFHSLRSFTPTLCRAMNVIAPKFAVLDPYLDLKQFTGKIEKALIYCPDAFGYHALKKLPELHAKILESSTHQTELQSIHPSVTPVCFASLFTGGTPEEHGIEKYSKPVLTCDTLFDALIRSGKKVAIISVKNSSIDLIFKERALDYYSMDYDPLVSMKALELLAKNEHDVIVVYHQEYDDLLHDSGLFSELAIKALEHHADSWEMLVRKAKEAWGKNFLVAFTPDHGGHIEGDQGLGNHGENIPEDMELRHFFHIN